MSSECHRRLRPFARMGLMNRYRDDPPSGMLWRGLHNWTWIELPRPSRRRRRVRAISVVCWRPAYCVPRARRSPKPVGPERRCARSREPPTSTRRWCTTISDPRRGCSTRPPPRLLTGCKPSATWGTAKENLGRAFLTLMLKTWADPEKGPTLLAVLQTAAHEQSTRDKLRRIVEGSLMGVSTLGVDQHDRS